MADLVLARTLTGLLGGAMAGALARVARPGLDRPDQQDAENERAATRIEPFHETFLQRTIVSGGARRLLGPRPVKPTSDPPPSAHTIAF